MSENNEILTVILDESRKGNVVLFTIQGLAVMPLDEFIQQPADGILYDLHRLEEEIRPSKHDTRAISDFAAAKTIRALRNRVAALEKELAEKER